MHLVPAAILGAVREGIRPLAPPPADPLAAIVGVDEFEPAPVDQVVYG
jgi:hypothetical protein